MFLNNVFDYLAWNLQLVVRLQLLEIHRDDGWNAQNGSGWSDCPFLRSVWPKKGVSLISDMVQGLLSSFRQGFQHSQHLEVIFSGQEVGSTSI